MKDVLFEVELLYEAGMTIEEIANRLHIAVPVVNDMLKWIANHADEYKND